MRQEEKVGFILEACRPRSRKRPPLFGIDAARILGGLQPNKNTGIGARALQARRELREDIHFLAGILTVLPLLKLRRGTQLKYEGERVLAQAYSFANTCEPTAASVRNMRVFGERILRFVRKVEKGAKRSASA